MCVCVCVCVCAYISRILFNHKKNETMLPAATWVDLEIIILNKVRERQIPYDITYIWNLKNWYKWTYLQNINRHFYSYLYKILYSYKNIILYSYFIIFSYLSYFLIALYFYFYSYLYRDNKFMVTKGERGKLGAWNWKIQATVCKIGREQGPII